MRSFGESKSLRVPVIGIADCKVRIKSSVLVVDPKESDAYGVKCPQFEFLRPLWAQEL